MFPALLLFVIAWGVLSFGAVYSWAFRPLMAGAAACGLLLLSRSPRRRLHSLSVVLVSLVVLPILLQTIPLPHSVIESVAPFNASFLQAFDLRFVDGGAWHALSVDPSLTLTSAAFLVIGAIWIAGVARGLGSSVSLVSLIRNIVLLSVLLSLLALAQKAMFNGKIYWFWESQFGVTNNYFGPFVNRNHFAGWMLLTLSLGGGYFMGRIAVAGDRMKRGFRERLLWIGSPQGGGVLITGVALMVMAVSLVWTLSRSGIAGATVAITILMVAATLRRATTVARSALAAGLVVLAFGGAALWKGLNSLALWYGNTHSLEWRFALWRDTLAPLKDFWLLGSGLNTYGTVMLLYPQTDTTVHAQQTHNDYLQLAVEGGLLVCIPVVIAIVLLARLMWVRLQQPQDEMTWWIRMGAIAGICGMAVQEISEFSLQIPGVALLFATCVAIAIHEPAPATVCRPQSRERRRSSRRVPDGAYA